MEDNPNGNQRTGQVNPQPDILKIEYGEVCTNFRHYSTLRFAILTVFIGMFAGIAIPLFDPEIELSPFIDMSLKVLGVIVSFVFFAYLETAAKHLTYYSNRAAEIEKALQFENLRFRELPKGIMRMSNATRLLFGAIGVFWILEILLTFFPVISGG
jgi:hypothetical protein